MAEDDKKSEVFTQRNGQSKAGYRFKTYALLLKHAAMIEKEFNGHKLVMYDSIDELPLPRYHKFNKYLMIDSGIGENVEDADRHMSTIIQMNARGDKEALALQVNNLQQALHFAMQNVSPKSMAFAVMVKSVNGKPCDDISEFGLQKLIDRLAMGGISYGLIRKTVELLKKKSRRESKVISLA